VAGAFVASGDLDASEALGMPAILAGAGTLLVSGDFTGSGGRAPGLERLGRDAFGSGERACAVFSEPLHGANRKRLRGRSPPSQFASDGPTKSATASAMPVPNAMRNHRTLKMLGWRRIRCDTSGLTRLILEFPKYDRMLAGQC
jgi:hypothetical protein